MTESNDQKIKERVAAEVEAMNPVAGWRHTLRESRFLHRLTRNRLGMIGGCVLLAFCLLAVGAWFLPESLGYGKSDALDAAPSMDHWFGTDALGRDIFWRIIRGSTYTIGAGFAVIGLAGLIGLPLGLISGYVGGRLDAMIMRGMDLLLAFPTLLLALALIAALGASLQNAIIAIGIVLSPRFARIVRASALQIREMEYIMAARSGGATSPRILFYHVLPNALSPLLVLATLSLSTAILEVAALSFLGLGEANLPEWGAMLNEARSQMAVNPQMMLYPGLALAGLVFAVNIFGDALRDAFDVQLGQ